MPDRQRRTGRTLMVELQNDVRQGISIRLDNVVSCPVRADDILNVSEDIAYMGNPIRTTNRRNIPSDA